MCPSCAAEIKRASVYRQRICMDCGATFMGYPKSKRCPDCRQAVNRARERAYKRDGAARHLGDTDICQSCGASYIVCGSLQRYCKDCAPDTVRANVQAIKRDYTKGWKSNNADLLAERRKFNKVCVVCGRVFNPGTSTVTCSPECAKKWKALKEQESLYRHGKRITPPGVKYESGLPKSGIVGVTARRNGLWQAAWKGHYIGVYATVAEAVEAIENYKKTEESEND